MPLLNTRPMWLLCGVLAVTLPSAAGAAGGEQVGLVPKVEINRDYSDRCVEDTEFMRRNHMKLLLHQRDETVHRGIRTKKYSLRNCINCHASKKTNSVLGENGFCESCHRFAAVTMDCFSCHSDQREEGVQPVLSFSRPHPAHPGFAYRPAATLTAGDRQQLIELVGRPQAAATGGVQ